MINTRVRNYTDLKIWQLGMELVKRTYVFTRKLPKDEVYGLVSQMRRAAVSVPSNIAEGHRYQYPREFIQFLHKALGSLAELETQFILAQDIYNIEFEPSTQVSIEQLNKKIYRLIDTVSES